MYPDDAPCRHVSRRCSRIRRPGAEEGTEFASTRRKPITDTLNRRGSIEPGALRCKGGVAFARPRGLAQRGDRRSRMGRGANLADPG